MRYKSQIRNFCKLLGIYFIVSGVAGIIQAVVMPLMYMQMQHYLAQSLLMSLSPLFELVAGVVLFWQSGYVVNLIVPGDRPYCPECGYDFTGNTSAVCPECGLHPRYGRQE